MPGKKRRIVLLTERGEGGRGERGVHKSFSPDKKKEVTFSSTHYEGRKRLLKKSFLLKKQKPL